MPTRGTRSHFAGTGSRIALGLALAVQLPVLCADARTHVPSPPMPLNASPDEPSSFVEVWVDLSVPELASVPRGRRDELDAQRQRIQRQQDDVMQRLAELGAVEQARVQLVRNALAVRMPLNAVAAARNIAGVRAVRPVMHRERSTP